MQEREQSSVNTLGRNSHPAPLLLPPNVVFCFGTVTSTQCSRYERPLQAMGVKEGGGYILLSLQIGWQSTKTVRGRACKWQLGLHTQKKGRKKRHRSSTSQMRACRHPLCCNELRVGWEKYPAWGYLSSFQHFWRVTSEKKATQTHNTFCSQAFFHWATQQSIKSLHKQQPCFMRQHGQSQRFDIKAQCQVWKFLIAYLDSIFLVCDEVYACLHSGICTFS